MADLPFNPLYASAVSGQYANLTNEATYYAASQAMNLGNAAPSWLTMPIVQAGYNNQLPAFPNVYPVSSFPTIDVNSLLEPWKKAGSDLVGGINSVSGTVGDVGSKIASGATGGLWQPVSAGILTGGLVLVGLYLFAKMELKK